MDDEYQTKQFWDDINQRMKDGINYRREFEAECVRKHIEYLDKILSNEVFEHRFDGFINKQLNND